MSKTPKSVMKGREGKMVVVCNCFVLFWEIIKGPFELLNMECFGRKRCYLLLAITNDKQEYSS